ncbi:MAG: response regulator [Candidatus Sulfobium sp.]|jgi:two-component system, probable response regulator PhcQ
MKDAVLIIDDEPNVLAALKRTLVDEPYEIYSANNGADGLEMMRRGTIKVVISDEKMPAMSGTEFLARAKECCPDTIRIMLTGYASLEAAMKAVNKGEIYRFFSKPWNETELRLSIRSALEKYNLEAENRRLLKIVKRQAINLRLIESQYPNITKLQKDREGNLILPDISEEEFDRIVLQCEREFT